MVDDAKKITPQAMASIKKFFFDPILEEHIRKFGNKGSGSSSYISKTIYEEFIQLLAQKVSAHCSGSQISEILRNYGRFRT